jgi:hypothetical protein
MRKRITAKKIACCSEGIYKEIETPEESAKAMRRADFMKSKCATADLYLFSIALKKEITQFKNNKRNEALRN